MRNTVLPLLAFFFLLLLSGCAQLFKPPADDAAARLVLERLMEHNKGLTQFKGLARVQMKSAGKSKSGRIAFVAVWPDKMRVELLNMMGGALTSLVGDGEYISIRSHMDNKHYRTRQSRTALEPVIHLPIGIEDLQCLLAGRVPLPPHSFARSEKDQGPKEIVLLKNRWHGLAAKLQVDAKTHRIENMQVYDREGGLLYRIHWQKWKTFGDYTLPAKVMIESLSQQQLNLSVDRFWPDIEVAPSMFVLDLPRG